MERKSLGVAVIGSGRIGTHRARISATHPSVSFVAVSDRDAGKAAALAAKSGAHFHADDNNAVIDHPSVNAVIVSTPEGEHVEPVCRALERGLPVLLEKPLSLTLPEADRIMDVLARTGGNLRVGYSRRFQPHFLRAKEQLVHGRLGRVTGGFARVYNSRAQAFAILARDAHATPVVDVLTYYVDLMNWFLNADGENPPVEVVARGQHGIFRDAGYDAHDLTWAIVTFADGAVVNFGVCYALPARYPTLGQADRVELLGTEGVLILDNDRTDQILYTEKGIPHAYVPEHAINMAFLGTTTPGDWVMGDFWGPLGSETRAWLDHVVTGHPTVHTTPAQARVNLETTIAIERAARTGATVRLPIER